MIIYRVMCGKEWARFSMYGGYEGLVKDKAEASQTKDKSKAIEIAEEMLNRDLNGVKIVVEEQEEFKSKRADAKKYYNVSGWDVLRTTEKAVLLKGNHEYWIPKSMIKGGKIGVCTVMFVSSWFAVKEGLPYGTHKTLAEWENEYGGEFIER